MCGKTSDYTSSYGSTGAIASVGRLTTPILQDKTTILESAYRVIRDLSFQQQYITADDVQNGLALKGFNLGYIGNLAGSFFKEALAAGYVTKLTGIVVPSKRAGRNRSSIGVYESRGYTGSPKQTTRKFIETYNPARAKGATAGR